MSAARSVLSISLLVLLVAVLGTAPQQGNQPARGWRAQFTAAAAKIRFGPNRSAERDVALRNTAEIPRRLLNLQFAIPVQRETSRVPHIDMRITSDSGYPQLGIAPGTTYVWKDFEKGKMRLLMIPADTTARIHWIAVRSHPQAPTHRVPRIFIASSTSLIGRHFAVPGRALFALGCTDWCSPPASWCVWNDTSAAVAVLPSSEAFGRYFRSKRIAWP
ncbi:MAG TPA: hypothetical protein VJN70_17680 [Gemmatimonadaceae bacterium]|nr:hypothetical protein [Gemmatimonadaceae bacterium]